MGEWYKTKIFCGSMSVVNRKYQSDSNLIKYMAELYSLWKKCIKCIKPGNAENRELKKWHVSTVEKIINTNYPQKQENSMTNVSWAMRKSPYLAWSKIDILLFIPLPIYLWRVHHVIPPIWHAGTEIKLWYSKYFQWTPQTIHFLTQLVNSNRSVFKSLNSP